MGLSLIDAQGNYAPQINSAGSGGAYTTPAVAGIPQFENGYQFTTKAGRVKNFEAFNSSDDELYVVIYDTNNGASPSAGDKVMNATTIPAKGFESIFDNDIDFDRGLYARAFTDPALTIPAGDVMSWAVKWTF